MKNDRIWAWLMPSGKIYKVITNSYEGTIEVYSPSLELISMNQSMSREAVNLIEDIFLSAVATEITEKKG